MTSFTITLSNQGGAAFEVDHRDHRNARFFLQALEHIPHAAPFFSSRGEVIGYRAGPGKRADGGAHVVENLLKRVPEDRPARLEVLASREQVVHTHDVIQRAAGLGERIAKVGHALLGLFGALALMVTAIVLFQSQRADNANYSRRLHRRAESNRRF